MFEKSSTDSTKKICQKLDLKSTLHFFVGIYHEKLWFFSYQVWAIGPSHVDRFTMEVLCQWPVAAKGRYLVVEDLVVHHKPT